jgi:thioesterase domain-containing protein/acyl carrier protein
MVPATITVLDALPLTPNGKVDRRALPEPDLSSSKQHRIPPRDTLELRLLQIWQQLLGDDAIDIHSSFFDVGGHSLLAMRLMSLIAKQFGIRLPVGILFQQPTIVGVAQALRQADATTPRWSHVVPICTEGDHAPLYLLPGAVGSVLYLQPLAAALGRQRPLYALQTPGLHGEAPTPECVEDLAALHVAAVRELQPHGPYHLAGHSSGGRVAFEMARQLEGLGQTVAWVAILDTNAPAPDQPIVAMPQTDEAWLANLVQVFEELGGVDLHIDAAELSAMGDTEAAYLRVLQALQHHELIFTSSDTVQALRYWVQVYRATVFGHASYRCNQALQCAIHLLRAAEQPAASGDTDPPGGWIASADWGWGALTQGALSVTQVPGSHISMMTQPHVQTLAQLLHGLLAGDS